MGGSYILGSARKIRTQRKKFDSRRPGTALEDQGPGGWVGASDQGGRCEFIESIRPGCLRIYQGWIGLSIG